VTEPKLMSLEVWWLHRLEHILVLTHLVAQILLLALKEDPTVALVVLLRFAAIFRRNNLNVTVAGQKFHVWRAVKQHLSWDGWQGVGQIAQLVTSMREAAVVLELAHASLLIVAADLRFVVRVYSAYIVSTRVVIWHRLNKKGCQSCSVSTRTSQSLNALAFMWTGKYLHRSCLCVRYRRERRNRRLQDCTFVSPGSGGIE